MHLRTAVSLLHGAHQVLLVKCLLATSHILLKSCQALFSGQHQLDTWTASHRDPKPCGVAANDEANYKQFPIHIYHPCSQSHETNLDKRMIEELAGRPPHLWVTFQAVAKEVFPFWAHFVRNGRFMTHPHFIHDLEVVLIFVPRPLQQATALLSARFGE